MRAEGHVVLCPSCKTRRVALSRNLAYEDIPQDKPPAKDRHTCRSLCSFVHFGLRCFVTVSSMRASRCDDAPGPVVPAMRRFMLTPGLPAERGGRRASTGTTTDVSRHGRSFDVLGPHGRLPELSARWAAWRMDASCPRLMLRALSSSRATPSATRAGS